MANNKETTQPRTHLNPPATDAASVELLHRVLRVPRVFHQDEGEPCKTQFNISKSATRQPTYESGRINGVQFVPGGFLAIQTFLTVPKGEKASSSSYLVPSLPRSPM